MANYDEDLHENHFFKALVETNNTLYNKAADNKWLICVPRSDTVSRLKLGRNEFESHVLIPCSEDGMSYRSVNNKMITINSSVITTGEGYRDLRRVSILFEETFFNQRDESYRVLCLAQPLEGAISDEPVTVTLESCDDCMHFLWSDSSTHRTKRRIDGLLQQFSIVEEQGLKTNKTRIAVLVDVCKAFFAHAIQFAMRDGNIKRLIHGSGVLKNALYLSIETYIMSQVYPRVFKEVCVQRSGQDADLNAVTRKLSDVSPQQLGVKAPYETNIVAVRDKLSSLNNYHTPLEKLVCIKVAISLIHDPTTNTSQAMTADELLSIFVYLIVTCDIPNWFGNVVFIKGFSLSHCVSEDHLYLLTSLEAGLQYLTSNHLSAATPSKENTGGLEDSGQTSFIIRTDSIHYGGDEKSDVELLFESIIKNDIARVKGILNKVQDNVDFSEFCHPLCECDRCVAIKQQQNIDEDDSDSVTVYSRGEHGRTGLHHAARKGHVNIIELLLDYGSSVMAPDNYGSTPLHLACQKGHQRATLLLLSKEADSNGIDHRSNTPLHLACSYGHVECVKALLFHTSGPGVCNVNATNDAGDTALHNAARWGFGSIVSLLLEHRANPLLKNKNNETPLQCAYNKNVRGILLPVVHPGAYRDRRYLTMNSRTTVSVDERTASKSRHTSESHLEATNNRSATLGRTKSLLSNTVMKHDHQQGTCPPSSPSNQSKMDRLVKKLLKAGVDGDLGMVKFLLHWNQPPRASSNDVGTTVKEKSTTCHPLCECDNCIKMKININSSDTEGLTVLHQACLHGHRRLVELLMEHNADIDAMTTDDRLTPLHYVCQYNHKDIVLLLLENKVKLNPQDVHMNTPLHFCCNNGHMESATLLMIHGADVNITNDRGDTPLHNAARWNHPELVHELLLYGAKFMTVNRNGLTPYDLTKSEDCKRTLLDAREGVIQVGIHATKPGDIQNFSSSNIFDSSSPVPPHNYHDNKVVSPSSDGSWDLIESSSPVVRKRIGSSTASGVSNIFKDIESYDRSLSSEK